MPSVDRDAVQSRQDRINFGKRTVQPVFFLLIGTLKVVLQFQLPPKSYMIGSVQG
ncbi:hypothetical protein D3C81_1873610 [compost metagenome]